MSSDRRLEALSARLHALEGEQKTLSWLKVEAKERLQQAQERHEQYNKALAVLQELEQQWRRQFEERLADVLSWGLSEVFGTDLKVRIATDIKRGTSHTRITVVDGDVETDVLDYEGGSLVNVLTVLLRILMTVSLVQPQRKFFVLDEPFSMVSVEYRPALCHLLRELAHRYDLQFLIVSHEPELIDAADVAYLVGKTEGRAVVKKIKRREETML